MEQNEYFQDLAIDVHKLEEEWLLQPSLFMKYSQLVAIAQKNHDEAKEKIDVVRANLDNKIRSNPIQYGCGKDKSGEPKTTESWISSTIILQPEYSDAISKFNNAKYELNILTGAVRAFDHRKKALEMEVELWVAGYYAGPSEKRIVEAGKRILGVSSYKQTENLNISRKRRVSK